MLWSLVKILVFVAVIGMAAVGAGWLMETEGGVQVTVGGMEYSFSPLQSVMAALALVVLVWIVLKLASLLVAVLRFLNGDETALTRFFARGRERKGYQALADGLMALASGEARLAMSKASRAKKYLNKPELTNLLTAQAAEMSGDTKKATDTYKKLIRDDRTRFVGVRGIMKQKLAEGDSETARKLAEKAFELKPHHEEVQDTLLRLQAQANDWAGARATLGEKLKSGTLPRDVYTRREAVLALSEASDLLDKDATIEAQEDAIQANRLSPDLIPAAVMAARSYIRMGKPRNAVRVLKKAWGAHPHPDLAAAFAEIAPDETPQERLKRFAQLLKINPDDPEAILVRAELLIVAEEFAEARKALSELTDNAPDARSLTLMAAAERGAGASDATVQGWLTKALNAPRGPQWVCDNCGHAHGQWRPVCEKCEGFDTLTWRTPDIPEQMSSVGHLIVPLGVTADDASAEAKENNASGEAVSLPPVELLEVEEVVPGPDNQSQK